MSQQIESVKMALQELGINASGEFYYNPDYDLLIAHETSPELTGAARGVMTDSGAVAVDTGIFTGRSPLAEGAVTAWVAALAPLAAPPV